MLSTSLCLSSNIFRIGLYKNFLSNHKRTKKLTIWAANNFQSKPILPKKLIKEIYQTNFKIKAITRQYIEMASAKAIATIAIVWIEEEDWGLRAIPRQAANPIKPTAIAGKIEPTAITKAEELIIYLNFFNFTDDLIKFFNLILYFSAFNKNQR
jgi:hypothetical protein